MRAVLGISKPIPVSIPSRCIADATFDGSNIPGTFQHMRWPRCHASGSAMAGISCTRLTTKLAFHLAYSLWEYQGHRVPHIRCTIRSKSTCLPMEALRTSSPLCQRNERKYYLDPVKDGTRVSRAGCIACALTHQEHTLFLYDALLWIRIHVQRFSIHIAALSAKYVFDDVSKVRISSLEGSFGLSRSA